MPRNLVICCDGTWNTPEQKDRGEPVTSNIRKISVAAQHQPNTVVFYDPGIGTGGFFDKYLGGAVGLGLTDNIKQTYRFLVEQRAGEGNDEDHIYLFGFSRGAYTVRSLGGLLRRCGLVRSVNDIDEAYELYRKSGHHKDNKKPEAERFKARQKAVGIHFLGVFDTVGALGIPTFSTYGLLHKGFRWATAHTAFAHGFHDQTLGTHVRHACHALAIDEHRGAFAPSMWEADPAQGDRPTVEQVWFAGGHSNVGGGYRDAGLSDTALVWMTGKAMAAGLHLDAPTVQRWRPDAYGEVRSEFEGLYKLTGKHYRAIGATHSLNEKVHRSVIDRIDRLGEQYQPSNYLSVRPVLPVVS